MKIQTRARIVCLEKGIQTHDPDPSAPRYRTKATIGTRHNPDFNFDEIHMWLFSKTNIDAFDIGDELVVTIEKA